MTQSEDESSPRPIVQVGRKGDVGIVEIQDLMVNVKGPAAGAIVIQWNVHGSSKGSAGLWGKNPAQTVILCSPCVCWLILVQIRIFGSEGRGSDLSAEDCPKKTGHIFYQYQISNAKNIVMGMMQTDSPVSKSFHTPFLL